MIVRFRGPLTAGEGSVEVWDDGHGMDVATLQTAWLDIATDVKKGGPVARADNAASSARKGIGRLAAAGLAAEMMLTTRRAGADEVSLLIDWRDFDREVAYLDQIDVAWDVGAPSVFANGGLADTTFAQVPVPH